MQNALFIFYEAVTFTFFRHPRMLPAGIRSGSGWLVPDNSIRMTRAVCWCHLTVNVTKQQ